MHATSTNLGLRPGGMARGTWVGGGTPPRTGGLARYAAGFFVGLVMGGLAVHGLPSSGGEGALPSGGSVTAAVQSFRPCATEDDLGPCFWDAARRGNGRGRSFWALEDRLVYVDGEVRMLDSER